MFIVIWCYLTIFMASEIVLYLPGYPHPDPYHDPVAQTQKKKREAEMNWNWWPYSTEGNNHGF